MITITIKTDNAAFDAGERDHEIARILRNLAKHIEQRDYPGTVRDINGNCSGSVKWTGKDRL